ncbi:uncharacterized protein CLAFUR5_00331 [Fulvia fulva]|uniref:Sec39 domain-containing protein n=1 Tax=Passalora fulva TaxID=5499 RepID=A0A9Q8L6Z7_PASFU|nr:uncharacterized protein CLAFUR5_00331 [Fulvia fulva]UJO11363.1 hypothetical protein CLAFUR5_00331 [Fulvia fulva]
MEIKDLTPAQCVLLTVHLATESNIKALHSFTPTRPDALDPELVLRILLTSLPEALDPHEYTGYVGEVASRLYIDTEREDVDVNTAPVAQLSNEQAEKRVKKLHLLPILPTNFPPHAPKDLLTRFVCHRAYRIDSETGLLSLVPALIEPFMDRNPFIRTWYISVVLPLLRMSFEYYPDDDTRSMSLADFEKLSGRDGVEALLQRASATNTQQATRLPDKEHVGRDVKSLVGPWMYGHTERKRRRLDHDQHDASEEVIKMSEGVRKIRLDGVKYGDRTGHDWEYMYEWLVKHAVKNFDIVSQAVDDWDGPADIDLGGYDRAGFQYLDEDEQQKLELQYAQAAFASCYAAQDDTPETVRRAHNVLAKLAELLDFVPPPDLASSVDSLPKVERHATKLEQSQTVADLFPEALLRSEHPLTTPRVETYMLLQMMVYSAYQFSGLGYPLSLVNVTKLHFYASAEEQLDVLKKILRHLTKTGSRKDDAQWMSDRAKLLWLWNWGIDADTENPDAGAGVLGKIQKDDFEEEMLKAFTETSLEDVDPVQNTNALGGLEDKDLSFPFIVLEEDKSRLQGFNDDSKGCLPPARFERVVLDKVMESYDSASNGNKNRGGVKKAHDIITAFRQYFPNSTQFSQASALIAATHALSFYSLTLQHGVPFQPVSIRVSQDPLSLVDKVLEQNPRSYTKLDDLIDIARNLVSAGLIDQDDETATAAGGHETAVEALGKRIKDAERRVIFMAIEASLREEDFETAYSYIVNRLTPPGADIDAPRTKDSAAQKPGHGKSSSRGKNELSDDDISWRAAFLAGRYRGATASPPTLRRLEQRTELLSLALLLAPVSSLTEILAAWRRCEEEMTTLQQSQQQAEDDFDDRADKRISGGGASSALPGNFTVSGEQPELILNQKRREMGRMGASNMDPNDAPVSMFDLTRNVAQAFSKGAFPLRNAARSSGEQERSMHESTGSLSSDRPISPSDEQSRVRKRDMVANAVSGGLASGLGWVLGAAPANQQPQQHQYQHQQQ